MKLINKIIEYFYPFTNDPLDFIIKNKEAWYGKYYNILYSGNKGKTFKYLYHARSPLFEHGDTILNYNWTFDYETFNPEIINFSKYKLKFRSIVDIETYQDVQFQIYLNGIEDIKNRRKLYLERINKNLI